MGSDAAISSPNNSAVSGGGHPAHRGLEGLESMERGCDNNLIGYLRATLIGMTTAMLPGPSPSFEEATQLETYLADCRHCAGESQPTQLGSMFDDKHGGDKPEGQQ